MKVVDVTQHLLHLSHAGFTFFLTYAIMVNTLAAPRPGHLLNFKTWNYHDVSEDVVRLFRSIPSSTGDAGESDASEGFKLPRGVKGQPVITPQLSRSSSRHLVSPVLSSTGVSSAIVSSQNRSACLRRTKSRRCLWRVEAAARACR